MPKADWGGATTGALTGAAAGSAILPGIGTVGGAILGGLTGMFGGKQQNPKIRNQSLLRPEQEPLYNQAINAGLNPGAGGAFGSAADYYRNNLSDNPADFNAFAAPALRQYNEDIVPGLSEQFARMGSGGLNSSGFRNAQMQGATDLAERLGAIRAGLRESAAAGLQNIGQVGLGRYSENTYNQPQPSGASQIAGGLSQGFGAALPGLLNRQPVSQNSSPYGGSSKPSASPQIRPFGSPGQGSLLPVNYGAR